jgi:hypothetical protein
MRRARSIMPLGTVYMHHFVWWEISLKACAWCGPLASTDSTQPCKTFSTKRQAREAKLIFVNYGFHAVALASYSNVSTVRARNVSLRHSSNVRAGWSAFERKSQNRSLGMVKILWKMPVACELWALMSIHSPMLLYELHGNWTFQCTRLRAYCVFCHFKLAPVYRYVQYAPETKQKRRQESDWRASCFR